MSKDYWDNYETTANPNADDDNTSDDDVDDNDNDNDNNIPDASKSLTYTPKLIDQDKIIYITKTGAFVKYSHFPTKDLLEQSKYSKKLENYFTLKTMQLTGTFKQAKRCKVDRANNRIIVPRFGIYEVLSGKFGLKDYTTVSKIQFGKKLDYLDWSEKVKLTPNQQIIVDYIMKNIYNKKRVNLGSAGLILNLEAGQGKSFLAAYLISKIKRKTAIILHSTSLLKQWQTVLETCYPDIKVGMYYCERKVDGDVILLIIKSALSKQFRVGKDAPIPALEYYNQFGFIIYDECHEYANNYAGKAFKFAQAPYMLGLSATPDENSNKFDDIITWEIGPILVADQLDGYTSTAEDFKGVVHRVNYYGPPEFTRLIKNKKTDMFSIAETINMICEDEERDNTVLECIKECIKKKLCTFVFADRREYLERLRQKLVAETSIDGEMLADDNDYIRIVGGAKPEAIQHAEKKSNVIYSTYPYIGTGKSIPKMNGLVLATPRKSKMKQYIKRIFRLGSDASIVRHIYDIIDSKTVLKNQWYTRKKYYDSQNFEIEEDTDDINEKIKAKPAVSYKKFQPAVADKKRGRGKSTAKPAKSTAKPAKSIDTSAAKPDTNNSIDKSADKPAKPTSTSADTPIDKSKPDNTTINRLVANIMKKLKE